MLEVLRTIVAWSEYIVVYFNDLRGCVQLYNENCDP